MMNHSSMKVFSKTLILVGILTFVNITTSNAHNRSSDSDRNEERELLALNVVENADVKNLVKVRGFVVDEFGEPMVGVEIFAEGSSFKAISNTEGKYTVMAKQDDTLKFSQFGVKTKKEKVTTSHILNISLAID